MKIIVLSSTSLLIPIIFISATWGGEPYQPKVRGECRLVIWNQLNAKDDGLGGREDGNPDINKVIGKDIL